METDFEKQAGNMKNENIKSYSSLKNGSSQLTFQNKIKENGARFNVVFACGEF